MNRTYGRWTVIQRAGSDSHRAALWLCRCSCGTVRPVLGPSLTTGKSLSCGCLRTELKAQCNRNSVQPLAVRFWSKVDKHGPLPHADAVRVHPEIARTHCWEWTGAMLPNGYGKLTIAGVDQSAHRTAWFQATGEWPRLQVLHKCDNRACVRKLHLFEGTQKQNVQDKLAKGR